MAHSRNWDSGNEAAPADTGQISGGAQEFRDVKRDVRERLALEHKFALTDGDEQGVHAFLNGNTAGRPSTSLTSGRLYANTQLNTLDFYDGSAWNVVGLESGTKMLFQQTAAPTGWTKDVTANLDNTALRLVTGSVGSRTSGDAFTVSFALARTTNSTGATVTGSASAVISSTNLNLSIANTNLNLSVAGHALTTNEMPAHRHHTFIGTTNDAAGANDYTIGASSSPAARVDNAGNFRMTTRNAGTNPDVGQSSSVGGGATHTHTLNGTTGSHGHTLNGTTGSHGHTDSGHTHSISGGHSHNLDMDVNYHDVILAAKD